MKYIIFSMAICILITGCTSQNVNTAEKVEIISEQEALSIAKKHDQNSNLNWTMEYKEDFNIEINNKNEKYDLWIATAVYPAGNKMVVYIDSITGETIVLSEIEAGM